MEPTERVGGLLTSGLSHSDFHSFESLTGAFLEFSQRVKAHYVKTYGAESEQAKASFEGTFGEPKVNLMVLEQMLGEQRSVRVSTGLALKRVEKEGARILAAEWDSIDGGDSVRVTARVFIDGSYEGDLLAMAGVPYHVGREGKAQYGESLAPEVEEKQLQA